MVKLYQGKRNDDLKWFYTFLILLNGGKNYYGKSRGTMDNNSKGKTGNIPHKCSAPPFG